MTHTPGPWFVGDDRATDCEAHANSGLALVDTGRESDWPIARLCEWNNAYLIAAAPDLLEALLEAALCLADVVTEPDAPVLVNARAAIAKATGAAPCPTSSR